MLINVRNIPEGHSVIEQNVNMTEEQIREGGFSGVVSCHAEIDRLHAQIYIRLFYKCKVNQKCSRCLNNFEYPIEGECSVVLQDRGLSKNLENEEDEAVDYYFREKDDSIDIRQTLFDEVMVNLPIMPLCRDNCPGLSKYSGIAADNISDEKSIDPRWEALKKLKKSG